MEVVIAHLRQLDVGERVLFGSRTLPMTVRDLEEIDETDNGIQFTHRVALDGPRGGLVVLKETSSGRILALFRGSPPAHVVRKLRWFDVSRG